MASSLELIALKLAGPGAAVLLAAAAFASGEAFGLDIGAAELGGAAIALFMLREVFSFVRWNTERKAPASAPAADDQRLEVQREIVDCLNKQTAILNRMDENQAKVVRITEQYQATGVCPLTKPLERDGTLKAISDAAERGFRRLAEN